MTIDGGQERTMSYGCGQRRRTRISVIVVLLLLSMTACGTGRSSESVESRSEPKGTSSSSAGQGDASTKRSISSLESTANCSADEVVELQRIQEFVTLRAWTKRETASYGMLTDTDACVVRIRSDVLTDEEEVALQKAGGRYLTIERVPAPRRIPGK